MKQNRHKPCLIAVCTLICLLATRYASAQQWRGFICFPDAAAGLRYDRNSERWNSVRISLPQRLVVRPVLESDRQRLRDLAARGERRSDIYSLIAAKVWVEEPGKSIPEIGCSEELPQSAQDYHLICQGSLNRFELDLAGMTFFFMERGTAVRSETWLPTIMAGSCTPF